ncbi:Arginine/serine-rich splicing factor scl25a transcript I, variant 2 [Cymbomonas tetramitiformis]|uniref:Arginine/serine-rich splicing factor scl25a transcript I, variant 2 n=1 Tax=Cymbomonas tetramitiformis TaxID=36881 RepID=A0AAE0GFZ7_9CHLO|nr:Arginine/serine-rich splicing factor scl25a transcript I, variant 2 [Cymbomonas tetramitiformis]
MGPRSRSPSPRGDNAGRGGERDDDRKPMSLLVRGLPRDIRSEDIRSPFERYGSVRDVYLPRDYYTKQPRGFGFVEFYDERDAHEAQYQLDRTMFMGREITVVMAVEMTVGMTVVAMTFVGKTEEEDVADPLHLVGDVHLLLITGIALVPNHVLGPGVHLSGEADRAHVHGLDVWTRV